MPATFLRFARAIVSLALLLGLGFSIVESPGCSPNEEDASFALVGVDGAEPAMPPGGDATAPLATPHSCCPCFHTYPAAGVVAFLTMPTVAGFPSNGAPPTVAPRDRHPQPLVPPPIA